MGAAAPLHSLEEVLLPHGLEGGSFVEPKQHRRLGHVTPAAAAPAAAARETSVQLVHSAAGIKPKPNGSV